MPNITYCDDDATIFLYKAGVYELIGFSSSFKRLTIAPFIEAKVEARMTNKAIKVITLDKADLLELMDQLAQALQPKLDSYRPPVPGRRSKENTLVWEYKGVAYKLQRRYNDEHKAIIDLLLSMSWTQKALNEDYVYKIFFKNDITQRDDSILRFINYASQGTASIISIQEHYQKILTAQEVLETVEKLVAIGCLTRDNGRVMITDAGKHVVE